MTLWLAWILPFLVSFSISALLVITSGHRIKRFPCRDDLRCKQTLHVAPTPRIGGVAIMFALLIMLSLSAAEHTLVGLLAVTLLPVFFAGLAEDLGYRVTPRKRLLAAVGSAGLASLLLGMWIPPLGIPGIDAALAFAPVAILVTILWSAGVCHGFNLIDGVNGLAAGTGIAIALGLGMVSAHVEDLALSHVVWALVPAFMGFMALNWPWGRIFLGDAGAYIIGHVLVWVAIMLAWRSPDVSPLALSLMFFWPVADTLLAMLRRFHNRSPLHLPDRLHFHQIIYALFHARFHRWLSPLWINSLTGLVLLPFTAMPVVAAVVMWDQPLLALFAWGLFSGLFVGVYLLSFRCVTRRVWRPDG